MSNSIQYFSLNNDVYRSACEAEIADGADPDMVSQMLGHIIDITTSYYGVLFQSGGISIAPTEVVVPNAIKQKMRAHNLRRSVL